MSKPQTSAIRFVACTKLYAFYTVPKVLCPLVYLRQGGMFSPARSRSFVCLSVCVQDYSKTRAWVWMKCCESTYVGTWTNWLTFEPDPDYSPDAGSGLLSPISFQRCYTEFYVGKIRRIRIGLCSDVWFYNGFIRWASEPSKHLCRRYMRSTECPSSYY